MRTRLVMSFTWMVLLAAISSSTAYSLPEETGIEEFDIEKLLRLLEKSSHEDLDQNQVESLSSKKYLEIRAPTQAPTQNPILSRLKIAAFNIKQFGNKKFQNGAVMQIIIKIINRYDVILIQEVLGDIVIDFVKRINSDGLYQYEHVKSKTFGSSDNYQEQYLFLYRAYIDITFKGEYQFEDQIIKFERPPFSIRLLYAGIQFVLTALHAKPERGLVETEITQLLKNVYPVLVEWAKTNNILIMGDLNAGEGYLAPTNLKKLKAIKPFLWPLSDDKYTMICSENAHDRFIMTPELNGMMVEGSAKVFEFDEDADPDYKKVKACRVSDHYPIELTLEFVSLNTNKRPPSALTTDNPKKPKPNGG